jgi:hypothetical protein
MSNQAITWAYEQPLKSGPKFLLVILADMADEAGSCFPGVALLAQRSGMGQTAVRANLGILKELGLVAEERRHRRDGSRTSNRYWLAMGIQESDSDAGVSKSRIPSIQEPDSEEPKAGIRGGILEPKVTNPQIEPTGFNPPTPRRKSPYSDDFERFWKVYPVHLDKANAWKSWLKIHPSPDEVEAIIAGAIRYRDDPNRDPGRTKWGQGWLAGRRWEDEEALPAERGPQRQTGVERLLDIAARARVSEEQAARNQLFGELEA